MITASSARCADGPRWSGAAPSMGPPSARAYVPTAWSSTACADVARADTERPETSGPRVRGSTSRTPLAPPGPGGHDDTRRRGDSSIGGAETMTAILVLHGPNLNLLGAREPGVYGRTTLSEVDAAVARHAEARGVRVECRQSNHEGVLVDHLQQASAQGFAGVVLNP